MSVVSHFTVVIEIHRVEIMDGAPRGGETSKVKEEVARIVVRGRTKDEVIAKAKRHLDTEYDGTDETIYRT